MALVNLYPSITNNVNEETILDFFKGITPENIHSQITKTSNGLTDATFLCVKLPELEEQTETTKFILKFIDPALAANYCISSKALEILGMKVPELHLLDKNSPCFQETVEKIKTLLKASPPFFLGYMNALPGADLSQLIKSEAVNKLNAEQWKKIFNVFGKLAVFDLINANDDRFYRPESIGKVELAEPYCNAGNVMLDIPYGMNEERELKEIYCIDNGCARALRVRNNSFTSSKAGYLKKFFEAFTTFHKPEKHPIFAKIIFQGIKIHLKDGPDEEFALSNLTAGIAEGYQKLSDINGSEFINELNETLKNTITSSDGKKMCEKILQHTQICLSYLKEHVY